MLTVMTIVTFSLKKLSLNIRHNLPEHTRGFKDTKKQYPRDTDSCTSVNKEPVTAPNLSVLQMKNFSSVFNGIIEYLFCKG